MKTKWIMFFFLGLTISNVLENSITLHREQTIRYQERGVELKVLEAVRQDRKEELIEEARLAQEENNVALRVARERLKRIDKIESLLIDKKSPVADKASIIYDVSIKHGIEPEIVVSIAGQESSLWKVCFDWNCYGYGITDTGYIESIKAKDWGSFEGGLDSFCQEFVKSGYTGKTLDEISFLGYNTRESWRNGTNYFYNLMK